MTKILEFVGKVSLFGLRAIRDLFSPPFEAAQLGSQLAEIGSRSVPLIAASGFALGAVMTLHTRSTLITFGAESGGSALSRPIVIEGYSDGGDVGDQLSSSKNRAILVRQYLQSQYQLDPNNLGVVALTNSPPDGVGRSHWDGICVVVLRRHK